MTDYVIREAKDDDGPALKAMLSAIWSHYDGCVFDSADHPRLDEPATGFADAGGRLWLVVRDGEVAGALGLTPGAQAGEYELASICLEAQSRGQGLATAMLAGANAFAAASDGSRLGFWIDLRLVDGVRFAERRGFMREPGVRARHDGSDALEARFARDVAQPGVSPQPSEARPAGGV